MKQCDVTEGEPNSLGYTQKRCIWCNTLYPFSPPIEESKFVAECGFQKDRPAAPGDEMEKILIALGCQPSVACSAGCGEMRRKMNVWGPDGCREHKPEIVEHLKEAYKTLDWSDVGWITTRAVACSLAFTIRPFDICGSLVDEAIRLSEQKPAADSSSDPKPNSTLPSASTP